MSSRLIFYVFTSNGHIVKLGECVTVKDCSVYGVIQSVGHDLGLDGWNAVEVDDVMDYGGPGIKPENILNFVVNKSAGTMSLKYQSSIDGVVVPRIPGYVYVDPTVADVAPSKSSSL